MKVASQDVIDRYVKLCADLQGRVIYLEAALALAMGAQNAVNVPDPADSAKIDT